MRSGLPPEELTKYKPSAVIVLSGGTMQSYSLTPSGNAVSLEDEMLKAADNQGDYQLARLLYRKSLQTLRTAVGK